MSTLSAPAFEQEQEHADPPHGLGRWLFTTNHKDIGTLYLLFSLLMFFIGGSFALVIRRVVSTGFADCQSAPLQPAHHPARAGHDSWRGDAGLRRAGQLANSG